MTPPDEVSKDPHHRRSRRLLWRITLVTLAILAVAWVLAIVFWYDYYRAYVFFLTLLLEHLWQVYINLPLVVFGSMAAIVSAVGCYLRWPPPMGRLTPALRGLVLLAAVFMLHEVWFNHGWVPFRPLCFAGGAMFTPNRYYALMGPMTPEAANAFVDMSKQWWGEETARLSGPYGVEVRPAIAVFDNELNWNMTTQIARLLADEQGSGTLERDDLDRCEQVERILMEGGRVVTWRDSWGIWPWRTIDGKSRFVDSLRDSYKER